MCCMYILVKHCSPCVHAISDICDVCPDDCCLAVTMCSEAGSGLPLFIQLPTTSAHQGSYRSRSPASAGKKVSLLTSQMFYSVTTVCA